MSVEIKVDEYDVILKRKVYKTGMRTSLCAYCDDYTGESEHDLSDCLFNLVERIKVLENASS